MWDDELEHIAERRTELPVAYDSLMPHRVRNILLVSSLYDSFTFVEDGRLTSMLFSEYFELNIRYAPRLDRVSTATKALELLETERYDLVISMMRIGDMNVREFGRRAREIDPGLPVLLLAFNTRELASLEDRHIPGIDRVFVWNGDAKLFLAMIKYVEDSYNAWHDAQAIGVHSVLLIEDSIRFYSAYLPMLYTEIMQQSQLLMSDGLNEMQRMTRQHARPKILLASTWEEGLALYQKYREFIIGVIVDAAFPKNGDHDTSAGIQFASMVKDDQPDIAVLVQSSDTTNLEPAHKINAAFINKRSPRLLHDFQEFMKNELGFGDFVFRRPDSSMVTSAGDLRGLAEALQFVPEECFNYHVSRKDFSTWLIARTEFELARSIRATSAQEFDSPSEYRGYLVGKLDAHRRRSKAGIVSEFSSGTFEADAGFVRIGTGSLGGKGRGLAFFNSLLETYRIADRIPGVSVTVPPTAVLATFVFEQFFDSANLNPLVLGETAEKEIAEAIWEARFSEEVVNQLRTFLSRVRYPLAVRSSSLLEDASTQPFAGIYKTYMLPNNHERLEVRLRELLNAIKFVYASTYSNDAKAYLETTPNRLEEEKMAVVIQQMFGRRRKGFLYPDIAGVARSYNYYPFANQKPEDGVICAVLGLGRTVVEGGRCIRFSPTNPSDILDVMTPRDYLNCSQRSFYALDLSKPGPNWRNPGNIESNIVRLNLDVAKEHGSLEQLGAVYSPRDRKIHENIQTNGIRLVTMTKFLREARFKLAEVISLLLDVCQTSLSCPVEIEFAAKIKEKEETLEVAFLQVRPMGQNSADEEVLVKRVTTDEAICYTDKALGNGHWKDIQDIVYVPRDSFDRTHTRDIADIIGNINEELGELHRPYILIGPGRWGSADHRLGTPVSWGQIAHASCIIETDLKDFRVSPSQGSHFFQNMTSFGIGYFTVNDDNPKAILNEKWLNAQEDRASSPLVRHITLDKPIDTAVDGRKGVGAVMKPGIKASRKAN